MSSFKEDVRGNISPEEAEMVIKKTNKGTWALYVMGDIWGDYLTFQEAVSTYASLRVEE